MKLTPKGQAREAVLLKQSVERSEKLALLVKSFGPVATFGIKCGDVLTIPEAVLSIFPRCRVVDIADQVLVQISWIKTHA